VVVSINVLLCPALSVLLGPKSGLFDSKSKSLLAKSIQTFSNKRLNRDQRKVLC